jgi:hypothetical protein
MISAWEIIPGMAGQSFPEQHFDIGLPVSSGFFGYASFTSE